MCLWKRENIHHHCDDKDSLCQNLEWWRGLLRARECYCGAKAWQHVEGIQCSSSTCFLQSHLLRRTSLICPRWTIMMYRSHYTNVINLSRAMPSIHHALEKPAEPTLLEALQWSAVVSVPLGKGGASQPMWLLIPASILTLHQVKLQMGKQLQFSWVHRVWVFRGLGHIPHLCMTF